MLKRTAKLLARLRKSRPQNLNEFRRICKLRYLGKGVFRKGYRILGHDLIVKFPIEVDGIVHTECELRRLKRLRKFRVMREHTPRVYYYDRKFGVVVMQYCDPLDYKNDNAAGRLMQELIYAATKIRCGDIHNENVRQVGTRAMLTDFGY